MGSVPLPRAIGLLADRTYVERIAAIAEGCSETDEDELLRRGWRLYGLLRAVYAFVRDRVPDRLPELFPAGIVESIRLARDHLQSAAPGLKEPPNPALQRTRPAAAAWGNAKVTLGGPVR